MPKKRIKNKKGSCPTGKIRYRDEIGAMIGLASTHAKNRDETRHYKCNFCSGFHLTKQGRGS